MAIELPCSRTHVVIVLCVSHSAANLSESKPRMTTWHCDPDASDSDSSNSSGSVARQNSVLEQGMHVVAVAAKRVWDELYICKKPVSF